MLARKHFLSRLDCELGIQINFLRDSEGDSKGYDDLLNKIEKIVDIISKLEATGYVHTSTITQYITSLDLRKGTERTLVGNGLLLISDITSKTRKDLLRIHNIGRGIVNELELKLNSHGLFLKEEEKKRAN